MKPVRLAFEKDELIITLPCWADVVGALPDESKRELACALACDDDLFLKIVGILADGACSPDNSGWPWWSPGADRKARALLDSKLGEVAERRVENLKSELRMALDTAAREERWKNAYHTVAARQWQYSGADGYSEAHRAACEIVREQEKCERAGAEA